MLWYESDLYYKEMKKIFAFPKQLHFLKSLLN